MRLLTIAAALLFVSGCSSHYRHIPATDATVLSGRLDARVQERVAEEGARKLAYELGAVEHRRSYDEQVAARTETRTTYLAAHSERPEPIRTAVLAGDRLVLDMTMEEVLLVIPSDRVKVARRTVDERKVVELWTVTQPPIVDMTFRDGVLVTWTATDVSASSELSARLKRDGEPLSLSAYEAPAPYVPEYTAPSAR